MKIPKRRWLIPAASAGVLLALSGCIPSTYGNSVYAPLDLAASPVPVLEPGKTWYLSQAYDPAEWRVLLVEFRKRPRDPANPTPEEQAWRLVTQRVSQVYDGQAVWRAPAEVFREKLERGNYASLPSPGPTGERIFSLPFFEASTLSAPPGWRVGLQTPLGTLEPLGREVWFEEELEGTYRFTQTRFRSTVRPVFVLDIPPGTPPGAYSARLEVRNTFTERSLLIDLAVRVAPGAQ
ncbi:hypothetical protein [Calidithermus chliarophilus]|uniref:hypothetical protein n=1 Tax=Calidithermus chliarophilus TaxID=52023 RepID=UPI00146FC2B0|nr:hypothetical protein [Calidithermus chliarophilus]